MGATRKKHKKIANAICCNGSDATIRHESFVSHGGMTKVVNEHISQNSHSE